jgi:hypothetical protein
MPEILIGRHKVVDFEDKNATVSINAGTTKNAILQFTLKNNYRCFICFVGEAWDSGLDTYLTKRVKVDGATIYQLKDSTVQIAPPEQPSQEISPWIEVPQGSTILYEADQAAGGTTGNVTARIRVYYAALDYVAP